MVHPSVSVCATRFDHTEQQRAQEYDRASSHHIRDASGRDRQWLPVASYTRKRAKNVHVQWRHIRRAPEHVDIRKQAHLAHLMWHTDDIFEFLAVIDAKY